MQVDNSDFKRFAADLMAATKRVPREVQQVVSKGALNIKNDQQAQVRQSTHFSGSGVAESISYDMRGGAGFSEAEIGPVKGTPGDLLNIAYFGTSRGGGTVEEPGEALKREEPKFVKALEDVMEKAVP